MYISLQTSGLMVANQAADMYASNIFTNMNLSASCELDAMDDVCTYLYRRFSLSLSSLVLLPLPLWLQSF